MSRQRPRKKAQYRPRRDLPRLLHDAVSDAAVTQLLGRLHELRDQGDGDALTVLGSVYEFGLHGRNGRELIAKDPKRSRRYYEEAAELGSPPAMTRIADALNDSGPSTSQTRARKLYLGAARQGYASAAYSLAVSYLDDGRHREAVKWFRRAATLGATGARVQLALARLHGRGLRRNPEQGIAELLRLARVATSLSDFERQQLLVFAAELLRRGWLLRRNVPKAMSLLREAAEMGSEAAGGLLRDLEPD